MASSSSLVEEVVEETELRLGLRDFFELLVLGRGAASGSEGPARRLGMDFAAMRRGVGGRESVCGVDGTEYVPATGIFGIPNAFCWSILRGIGGRLR